jgi:hypothetical protein
MFIDDRLDEIETRFGLSHEAVFCLEMSVSFCTDAIQYMHHENVGVLATIVVWVRFCDGSSVNDKRTLLRIWIHSRELP